MSVSTQSTLSASELRQFGLILAAMIAVMFGIVIPWLWHFAAWPWWPWIIAGGLTLWALIAPATLSPIYHGWMKVAHVLAWINTRLILGVAFFLIILPTSLILKLFKKDPMARTADPDKPSYRITKKQRNPAHMERPF